MIPILSFRRAWLHVRSGLGRMVLSILAVALGVALVVATRLMNLAVLDAFLDTVDGMAGRAALTIRAGENLTFDEATVQKVEKIPGVTLAVPLVRSVAFPDDGSGEILTVHGVDLTNDAAVRVYHRSDTADVVDDLLVFISQKDSIILGRQFAERRGLEVGSRLDLVTPTGVMPFIVRGLLDAQGLAATLGGRLVVMDIQAAQAAFTEPGQVTQIDLLVKPGREEAVKAAVAAALPSGLTVEEPAIRKAVIRKTVAGFQAMLTAFALLAVVAGFVICYSRLGAIFEARTWEIGLMRAVGLRRWVVCAELLKESLILGLLGTAVGVPLGLAIGKIGFPLTAKLAALQYRLPVPITPPAMYPSAILVGLAVGLGAALLAAVAPALRLASKQPVAALTLRGRDGPTELRPPSLVLWLGLIGLAAGLIVFQQATEQAGLGNVTTALLAVLGCAGAWPLVRGSSGLVSSLWQRLFGPTGRLAAGHLREQSRRAALTVATLGVGLGAILMFGIVAWSFERTLEAQLTSMFKADLYVTSAFESEGWMSAPLSEGLLADLADLPGVELVAGEQRQTIAYEGAMPVLVAHDPSSFVNPKVCQWRLEDGALAGALDRVSEGKAVLVSSTFAQQFKVAVGDGVSLPSPHGVQTLPVLGITATEPTVAVIMSRELFKRAWNDPQVRWARIVVQPGADRDGVAAEIARRVGPEYRLQVRTLAQLVGHFTGQVRQAFSFLYLMEGVTLLLVLIGLGDTLATGVLERTREFGMMRAVGLKRSRLFAMVMLEGLAIGLLGLLLAVAAGMALGVFWVEIQFPALLGWDLDLHFPGGFASMAAALTVFLCLTGALLPAWRAARLSVPAALRNE